MLMERKHCRKLKTNTLSPKHRLVRYTVNLLLKMVMKYLESAELEDKTACAGVRADLKMCLLESECCKGNKMTPRQCLLANDPSIQQCIALKTLFFECKRSILDQRTRFRGRKGY